MAPEVAPLSVVCSAVSSPNLSEGRWCIVAFVDMWKDCHKLSGCLRAPWKNQGKHISSIAEQALFGTSFLSFFLNLKNTKHKTCYWQFWLTTSPKEAFYQSFIARSLIHVPSLHEMSGEAPKGRGSLVQGCAVTPLVYPGWAGVWYPLGWVGCTLGMDLGALCALLPPQTREVLSSHQPWSNGVLLWKGYSVWEVWLDGNWKKINKKPSRPIQCSSWEQHC